MSAFIRVGLIGFGGVVAHRHVPAIQKRSDLFSITAVSRGTAGKLADALHATGCHHGHADWRDLVKDPAVDAVLVASPNALHADQVIAALRAGKHVMCEKPPAMDAAEARAMADAAKSSGRVLQYGFLMRFADDTRRAREVLADGTLGEVYHIRVQWLRRRGYPTRGSWFTTKKLSGGGALADLGSHVLDRALYLLNYPAVEAVSAFAHRRLQDSEVEHAMKTGRKTGDTGVCDVEDLGVCLFRLAGGVSLSLEVSFAVNLPESPFLTDVLGDRAGLRLRGGAQATLYGEAHGAVTDTVLDPDGDHGGDGNMYDRQWEDFAACIRDGRAPLAGAEQGVALMRCLQAAYRSAAEGREVLLSEIGG